MDLIGEEQLNALLHIAQRDGPPTRPEQVLIRMIAAQAQMVLDERERQQEAPIPHLLKKIRERAGAGSTVRSKRP